MSKVSTLHEEICRILSSGGATFDGESDSSRQELTEEWAEEFTSEEVKDFVDAGCWDVGTAFTLRSAGFRPGKDTLGYRSGHECDDMSPMYALCNYVVKLDSLLW